MFLVPKKKNGFGPFSYKFFVCIRVGLRTGNRKPIQESLGTATTRSVFCVKSYFVSLSTNISLRARFRSSTHHASKKRVETFFAQVIQSYMFF